MVPIMSLWLPILIASVVVFFASFLAWMVLPHHRSDWSKLPDEDALRSLIDGQGVTPGQYTFPYCADPSQMKDPVWKEKVEKGPNGYLILQPPGLNMGKNLVLFFIYCVVISVFAAYLAGRGLAPGVHYLEVFQVAGTAAVLGYSGAVIPKAIWFGFSWSSVIKEVIDGIVYGLLTAGVFGWLWPAA